MSDDKLPWYRNLQLSEFAKAMTGTFATSKPAPKEALDFHDIGVRLCGERGVSFDKIRVVWWAFDGSPDGWVFGGARWQHLLIGMSSWQRQTGAPRLSFPIVPALWLSLSQDEALEAGFGISTIPSRYDYLSWRENQVTVYLEPITAVHELQLEGIPAELAPAGYQSRRPTVPSPSQPAPVAMIRCLHCEFVLNISPGSLDYVRRNIEGTRGQETQVRLAALYLRNIHPKSLPSEGNAARDWVRARINQPQRAGHPMACSGRTITP